MIKLDTWAKKTSVNAHRRLFIDNNIAIFSTTCRFTKTVLLPFERQLLSLKVINSLLFCTTKENAINLDKRDIIGGQLVWPVKRRSKARVLTAHVRYR